MENIAVVGIANLFPGSSAPEEFWQQLLKKQDCRSKATIEQMGVEPDKYTGKKGDIDKACLGLVDSDFKIVMSHDPSHWDKVLIDHKTHFHLTLSGHTHGMQFGIEIPGWIKWSPVKWAYKYWAGIYNNNKQFLNVNRGFGVLGFPGRVGIPPEISVIKLKKA